MARHWTLERLATLEVAFEGAEDPNRARDMARYMKNHFAFYGFPAKERRIMQRHAFKGAPNPTQADIVKLTNACWRKKQREFQYVGADYVSKHIGACNASFLPHLERLITHKSWWDTVDVLAVHGVGRLARRFPSVGEEMTDWIDADDFWIARTALLYQLGHRNKTDADQLFGFCERRMDDSEFFIRKAIGWALREYSKTDPRAVRAFVRRHDARLSGLSKREALKWLQNR